MPVRKTPILILWLLLSLLLYVPCWAGDGRNVVRTWWPDPDTGLIWASESYDTKKMTWEQAGEYCASLSVGGFSGWRLPTLDEMRAVTYFKKVTWELDEEEDPGNINTLPKTIRTRTYDWLFVKGGAMPDTRVRLWTTTSVPDKENQKWSVYIGPPDLFGMIFKGHWRGMLDLSRTENHESASKVTDKNRPFCTRPIDAEILQIVKDAQVHHPVQDVQMLKAYVPLNRARLAFKERRYKAAITEAQNALLIQPNLAWAYWAMGMSYGMMGQWTEAIANFKEALKIEGNELYNVVGLKWAKDSEKAARKGKKSDIQPPPWDWLG